MNWEAIAAVADIIASIAVVVSLVYLSIQIRRQTVETKLAMGNELVNQLNYVYANLSDNAELADLFYQGISDFHSLSPGRKIQISTYFSRLLRVMEGMFYQQRHGRIDSAIWSGLDRAIQDFCRYPGIKTWWETRKHWFSEEFVEYLSVYISDQEKPASYWEN